MENIVSKVLKAIVIIVAMICMVKCAYAPPSPSSGREFSGYYYNVIQLNDSTYLLNPTHNCTRHNASPLIITKDSLGFYLNENNK